MAVNGCSNELQKKRRKKPAEDSYRWSRLRSDFRKSLIRQFEVDRNLGGNLNGLAIQQIWFVLPLLDGIGCGLTQLRISLQHLHVGDVAALRNRRRQVDGAFEPHDQSGPGIDRLNSLDDQSLRHTLRNIESLQDWLWHGGSAANQSRQSTR